MTEQSTPSDLAAWVLDHGVGLTPARQKQLAKGYRRLEAQTDIRGRAVVIYRDRAREAETERDEWRQTALDERAAALDALEQIKVRDARAADIWDEGWEQGMAYVTGMEHGIDDDLDHATTNPYRASERRA